MDKLYTAAKFYKDNLVNREYLLVAGKNNKKIELHIIFEESHFKHLIGLHKLKDIAETHKPAIALFQDCIEKKLTYDRISQSSHFEDMKKRVDYFDKIQKALFSKNLMFKSPKGKFNSITADFLLSEYDEVGVAHLFLADSSEGITIPCTFIPDVKDTYSQSAIRWTVLDIREIIADKEQSSNRQLNSLLSESELLLKNKEIRYQQAKPSTLINHRFNYLDEEYIIVDIKLLPGQTKDKAILERRSDGHLFQDNDFASSNPLKLNLDKPGKGSSKKFEKIK